MKRLAVFFSLFSIAVCVLLLFLLSPRNIKAELTEPGVCLTTESSIMPTHMMPATMFKEYIVDLMVRQDPKVFDLLVPLMLMATNQHDFARKVLRGEGEVTDEQYLSLRDNVATAELARMIDVAAQGSKVAVACKRLLPYVKTLHISSN